MNSSPVETAYGVSESASVIDGKSKPYQEPLCPTIFHEEWWLDAATGGCFETTEVRSGQRAVGRLPFHTTKRFGMKLMSMPPLTYFLGPAVAEGNGTSTTRQLRRLEITRELLGNLPPASWQYVKCHGAVPDAIAFQERGFRAYVQFTHEIAPESPDVVWHRMRDKTRNVIRRAQERFATEQLMDPDEFVQLYERNLALKNIHNGLESRICRTLIMASLRRGRGEIMVARDNNKNIVAANFCVWDRGSTFYVLSTRSGESGNGGISLLLWQAIRRSTQRGLTFDFAGLGNQGSVLLYTGFGGVVRPRYVALRASGMARFIRDSRLLISAENCFY